MSLTAKQYDKIGQRIRLNNTTATRDLLLDDAINNIEYTLNKDGHTGKLSNPDGIIRSKPCIYKGFFIQCFGYKRYESDFDIYGKLVWYGFAKREITVKDRKEKVMFDVQNAYPLGCETEHEAGSYLFKMCDIFHENYRK
uniref:Uncharacterized protein n=1 Tax=viral metagenome TaxID=1070528 RepID=A0A6M3XSG2_9ZZZZ